MTVTMIDYIKNAIDIIFILLVPFLFVFLVRGVWNQIKNIRRNKKNLERLEAQKCKGPHSWVKMPILGQEVRVCKECCYSADLDGYVKREFLNAHLRELEFKNALEEYSKKRKTEIAEKFRLFDFELEQLEDEIYSIKKDFTIQWLEKNLKEILKEEKEEDSE